MVASCSCRRSTTTRHRSSRDCAQIYPRRARQRARRVVVSAAVRVWSVGWSVGSGGRVGRSGWLVGRWWVQAAREDGTAHRSDEGGWSRSGGQEVGPPGSSNSRGPLTRTTHQAMTQPDLMQRSGRNRPGLCRTLGRRREDRPGLCRTLGLRREDRPGLCRTLGRRSARGGLGPGRSPTPCGVVGGFGSSSGSEQDELPREVQASGVWELVRVPPAQNVTNGAAPADPRETLGLEPRNVTRSSARRGPGKHRFADPDADTPGARVTHAGLSGHAGPQALCRHD